MFLVENRLIWRTATYCLTKQTMTKSVNKLFCDVKLNSRYLSSRRPAVQYSHWTAVLFTVLYHKTLSGSRTVQLILSYFKVRTMLCYDTHVLLPKRANVFRLIMTIRYTRGNFHCFSTLGQEKKSDISDTGSDRGDVILKANTKETVGTGKLFRYIQLSDISEFYCICNIVCKSEN